MRSKYGNTRSWSELCRREFDSKAERRRGEDLHLLELAGEITDLEYQPLWILSTDPKVSYTADFSYQTGGRDIVEDVKGVMTDASRVRIAWLKQRHGVTVTVIRDG